MARTRRRPAKGIEPYQFTPEAASIAGRKGGLVKTGNRRRFAGQFMAAVENAYYEIGGEQAVLELFRIAKLEAPMEFLKFLASLMPREFEITDSRMKELSDSELEFLIELAARRIDSTAVVEGGAAETIDAGSPQILLPVPKAEDVS
jgi:hypothetical protein